MEEIWAPWRIKYILEDKSKGCLFCDKLKEKNDRNNFILYRGKKTFIMLNIYPYNNGHLMVAPYKHSKDFNGLNEEELKELMCGVKKSTQVLQKALHPEGFNIGVNIGKVSGAGVKHHIHIHVVPRWNGDTNFMPVTGNTKVICQSLNALYKKLKQSWKGEKL